MLEKSPIPAGIKLIAAWQKEYKRRMPAQQSGIWTPKEFATALRVADAGSALQAAPFSAANPKAETVV